MTDATTIELARSHVRHVRDFFYHLMTYVLIGLLLIVLDRRAGAGENAVLGLDWAYWVLIFWGFGILGHGIAAYFDEYRARRLGSRAG